VFESFIGTLIFDDMTFCRHISHLLRDPMGRSIKDIGDGDMSHLL